VVDLDRAGARCVATPRQRCASGIRCVRIDCVAPQPSSLDRSPALLQAGHRLGRYQILQPIASGGMASVYLGRAIGDAGFERVVAIKCCHAHLRGDDEFVTMFLDEARLSAMIHHPNVVAVLDVGTGDPLYLVMEHIEGDPLASLLEAVSDASPGQIPVPIVLRIMIDALTGLQAAHELCDVNGRPLRLVHRDVSPQNVLVGVDGTSRISDFGIAKAAARATVTVGGKRKGKLAYMSPEQVRGGELTARSDVFSAGIVLWEALAGRRLFKAPTEGETVRRITSQLAPAVSRVEPSAPAALDRIVAAALALEPERRFASAGEFAEALETSGVPVAPTRAVRDFVTEILASRLAARRNVLRQLVARPITATVEDFAADGTTIPLAYPFSPSDTEEDSGDHDTFDSSATIAERGEHDTFDSDGTIEDAPPPNGGSAPTRDALSGIAQSPPRDGTVSIVDPGAMPPSSLDDDAPVDAPTVARPSAMPSYASVPPDARRRPTWPFALGLVLLVPLGVGVGMRIARTTHGSAPPPTLASTIATPAPPPSSASHPPTASAPIAATAGVTTHPASAAPTTRAAEPPRAQHPARAAAPTPHTHSAHRHHDDVAPFGPPPSRPTPPAPASHDNSTYRPVEI
jgi:serine/threonine-protein kinase